MFKKKRELSCEKSPLILDYYKDGSLLIPKKNQKEILDSIKYSKIKEIELLDFSINNLKTQLLIVQKMMTEKTSSIENEKKLMIENIKREINPDLLCQICFERRVDIVWTPCGHTFCQKCFGENSSCFTCRGNVEKVHKIFFS